MILDRSQLCRRPTDFGSFQFVAVPQCKACQWLTLQVRLVTTDFHSGFRPGQVTLLAFRNTHLFWLCPAPQFSNSDGAADK